MITFDCAVLRLAELGNKKRLAIFRFLLQFGRCGAPVGQIQKELDIPGSTLSHHLSRLIQAGLVKQNRHKSTLFCVAQSDGINELMEFLTHSCCSRLAERDCPQIDDLKPQVRGHC